MGQLWPGEAIERSLMSQGAPETGPIPNAMEKPSTIRVSPEALEYSPTAGTKASNEANLTDVEGTPLRGCSPLQ
jgi:hypothetical protein